MDFLNSMSIYWKRFFKVLFCTFLLFVLGLFYYVLSSYGIGFKCPLYEYLGIQCGFCGATRMCSALIEFRFKDAFNYNQFLFVFTPVFILLYAYYAFIYIKTGEINTMKLEERYGLYFLILLSIFTFIRNVI